MQSFSFWVHSLIRSLRKCGKREQVRLGLSLPFYCHSIKNHNFNTFSQNIVFSWQGDTSDYRRNPIQLSKLGISVAVLVWTNFILGDKRASLDLQESCISLFFFLTDRILTENRNFYYSTAGKSLTPHHWICTDFKCLTWTKASFTLFV